MGNVFPKIASLCITRSIKEAVYVLQGNQTFACAWFADDAHQKYKGGGRCTTGK
ncbi:hypothetical protein AXX17_AT2G10710 [Arabidopsis thaliana]|uniref:Uncharacterized protein n=2 Tax=Arabidopsis thaliana TaxID=3702 RepID=A0A178VUD2_ARATH|nr:unknown [Arabidopsis thaliana]OAP09418.1 hypothetical protein AXX17_AT2G10710 [Arabidopsis thaliana]